MKPRQALARSRFLLFTPRALLACVKYRVLLALNPVELLNRPAPPLREKTGWVSKGEISRAVYFAARLLPGTHCLPQAYAARELLHRYGHPCELRIGVATNKGFRAHAWVTCGDETVHGKSEEVFVPLERA